jgi:hypothetical protein
MTPDQIAEVLNKARRARGEPDVNRDELMSMINEAKQDIKKNNLSNDEKRALEEFRMRELERSIHETPFWIKAVWAVILGGIMYWIFK